MSLLDTPFTRAVGIEVPLVRGAMYSCGNPEPVAAVGAGEEDIVLTQRVTGVPLVVIRAPGVERAGTHVGPIVRWMLRGRRTKRWMRAWYANRSAHRLKRSGFRGDTSRDYWQAEMSVAGITSVASVATIIEDIRAVLLTAGGCRLPAQ